MSLGLSLAGLVGMAQIGAIVQEAIPTGSLSVTTLYAPGQVLTWIAPTSAALKSWADASHQFGSLWVWLYLHLLFDLLFIAGYGLLGFTLVPEKFSRFLLKILIAVDVVEDLLAALAFTRIIHHHGPVAAFTVFLHLATVIKWLVTLILLVRLAFVAWDNARDAIGRLFLALWEQRFSVIVVAFLAVLAVGRGPDVLEQMPDVQRSWLTTPGLGWVHAGVAVSAQVLLAVLLLLLGRMRTRRAKEKFSGTAARGNPRYWPWILAPVALGVLTLAFWLADGTEIDWGRLGVAFGGPLLVAASSGIIEWRGWNSYRPSAHPHPGPADEARKREGAARTAGDALAVAVIAVTGLGLVRSFTVLALLAQGGYAVASWVAVVIGIAIATCIWPLANGPVRDSLRTVAGRADWVGVSVKWAIEGLVGQSRQEQRREQEQRRYIWWPWLIAVAPFLIATAALMFVPLWTTHWLGVIGTTVIATGTLAVVLAVLAFLAQTRKPLPLFQALRLNVTPVITLIAVIGLVGAMVGSSSAVHDIRGPVPAQPPADQTSLMTSLDTWLDDPAMDCSVPAAGSTANAGPSVRVRPLILVAAAGGGIRAAWWTEQALAYLAARPCGPQDVFAVSSVSGGSLGMAVLDSAPTLADANTDMAKIAGPDALGAGIDGLLLHDMIAGFTGLDLTAGQMAAGQRFSDRAGLIESAWQREDISLEQAFPLRRPALPWHLLFNSTDADSGCRAIIADQPLTADPGTSDPSNLTCDLRSAVPGSDSFDFFAKLPCTRNISMATAAMLSARFSYITPSGEVARCRDKNVLAGQFVDGGYVDSSGLLTLADLMPGLTAEVRARNASAVAQAQPGQAVTLVVPIVMYLGNSPRPDPVDAPAVRIQESVVPLDAESTAGAQLSTSDTMLQRIQGMLGTSQWLQCASAQPGCAAVEAVAEKAVPYQVIFVSPRTEPRISAPLGWVLSPASRDTLSAELTREEERQGDPCVRAAQPHVCQAGVGGMGDLVTFIQGG
jgi:hypothetical protein